MSWSALYPFVMLLSVTVGMLLSRWTMRPLGLSMAQRLGIGLGAFCGATVGAKLPFVLAEWDGLISGRAWFENGKTIVFGIVGGYFGVELAKHLLGIRIKTGDGFAVPVAAAVAVGRLGCFCAGCCYGTATRLPWGVDFGDGVRRHPTQLYECAFHLSAAAVLAWLWARGWLRGQLIKLYIMAYLAYRVMTEFIRPEPKLWLGLTGYQWAALALLPVFGYLWARDRRTLGCDPAHLTAAPDPAR